MDPSKIEVMVGAIKDNAKTYQLPRQREADHELAEADEDGVKSVVGTN